MSPRRRTLLIGATVALLLFAVMGLIISTTEPWQAKNAGNATDAGTQANDLGGITDSLFGPDVLAFEVLGILLTAAMIGALVIARPLDALSDESRYSHPTAEQKEQAQAVSDPKNADMSTTTEAPR